MRHVLLLFLAYIIHPSFESQFSSRVYKYGDVIFYNRRSSFFQFFCMGVEYSINLEPNNAIFHSSYDLEHSEYRGIVQEPYYGVAILTKFKDVYLGSLTFYNDTLYLEKSKNHGLSEDEGVIGYFASDTSNNLSSNQVAVIDNFLEYYSYPKPNPFKKYMRRKKRGTNQDVKNEEKNRCSLKIVADYAFYSKFGKNNTVDVTRYLVNMVARVNEIFTRVDWDEDNDAFDESRLVNMGFLIKEIKIQYDANNTDSHYNSFKNKFRPPNEILDNFAKYEGSDDFCLVHLVSGRTFTGDILGMAYVGTPTVDGFGGICSRKTKVGGKVTTRNVAMTSVYKGSIDDSLPLTTKEIDIVVAHEFGHAWGASHDPYNYSDDEDIKNCAPKLEDGGAYIMNPISQSGHSANNVFFSPCSKNNIRKVLKYKSSICFEKGTSKLCGNGIIDEGEQCDNGVFNLQSNCCDKNCLLYENTQCSPVNHACCTSSCLFHNSSHVCRESDPKFCKSEAVCNGVSGDCPIGSAVENGEECFDLGECRDGICLPYCEKLGKKSCICKEPELSCRRCCIGSHGNCTPEFGNLYLQEGTSCIQGICRQNKCVYQQVDHVRNFLTTSFESGMNFGKFVKANQVIIVVIVVSMFYGFCVFIVHKREQFKDGVIEKEKKF